MDNATDMLRAALQSAQAAPAAPTPSDTATNMLRSAIQSSEAGGPAVTPAPDSGEYTPEIKKALVSAASDQKKLEIGGLPDSQTFLNAFIMRRTGAGVQSSVNPIEKDLATLSGDQIVQKYGAEQGSKLLDGLSHAGQLYDLQKNSSRSATDAVGDTILGIGQGVGDTLGSIPAVAAALTNADAGVLSAHAISKFNDYIQGSESLGLQTQRSVSAAKDTLEQRDEDKTYQGSDSSFLSGLEHFGREAIRSAKNTVSNPALFSDTAAQTIGSLAAVGPLARGVGAISRSLIPEATRFATGNTAAIARELDLPSMARVADTVGSHLPSDVMVAGGLMGAGGAYQGNAEQIANMSTEDLQKVSPEFRSLVDQGMSPTEARNQVANKAGLLAAAIAGPAATLTSHISEDFEKNPFLVQSLGHAGANLGKQTAEQTLQSVEGQFAQNVGQKVYGDPTKDLTDNLGESAAQGAIGGLTGAAIAQAPGALLAGAKAGGKAVAKAVIDKTNDLLAKNAQSTPASDAEVSKAGAEISTLGQDPNTQTVLNDAIEKAHAVDAANTSADSATTEPTAHGPAMEALASKILDLSQFDPKEVDDSILPKEVKDQVQGSTDRVDYMQKLADVVNDPKAPDDHRIISALELHNQIDKFGTLFKSDPGAMEAIGEDHPANKVVEKFNDLDAKLSANPTIIGALGLVAKTPKEVLDKIIKPVADKDLNTPDGQNDVARITALAGAAPDKLDLATSETLLKQASDGKVKLTQEQHQALLASQAIMRSAQTASDEQAKFGHKKLLNSVTDDILTTPGQKGEVKNSASGFAKNIFQAMRAGNTEMAGKFLGHLKDLAQLSQNKVDALNAHYQQGGGDAVPYQSINSHSREWYAEKSGMQVSPKSRGQVEFSQRVNLENERIAGIYNGLSKAFPALNGGQIETKPLHANLQGKVEDVVKAHRGGELATTARPDVAIPDVSDARSEQAVERPAETPTEEPKAVATPDEVSSPQATETETKGAEAQTQEAPKASEKVEETIPTSERSTGGDENSAPADREIPKTVKDAYPTLFGAKKDDPVVNFFHKAFRVAKDSTGKISSRLFGDQNPYQMVRKALKSTSSINEFMEGSQKKAVPAHVIRAYKGYLDMVPALRDELNARLQEKLKTTNERGKYTGGSFSELFAKGRDINQLVELKTLNLVEQQTDGSFKYNQALIDQALMAGLQWHLVSDNYRSDMDADLVSSLTSNAITPDKAEPYVDMLDIGLSPVEAVRSLADKISDFWGVQKNNDVSISYTDGIPASMAVEILKVLESVPAPGGNESLMRAVPFVIENGIIRPAKEGEDLGKIRHIWRLVSNEENKENNPLRIAPNLLEELALTEPKDRNYYGGDKLPAPSKTQMRSPLVPTTGEQRRMIDAAQKMPYYLNTVIHGLYNAIGHDGLLSLFGAGDLTDRKLNARHKLSLEGKNTSVRAAFEALNARVSEMETLQDGEADPATTAIHYTFNVSSVGRLQMLGSQNPQASKLVREAILPTWSTLDLSPNGNREHLDLFNRTIAQALGLNVQALDRDTLFPKLHDILENKLSGSVEALADFLATGKLSSDTTGQLKADFAAAEIKLTPNALHALTEFARWRDASEAEQSKFRTGLYLEADGVTNGVVNAMHMLSTGEFTPEQIQLLAKGGLFFTGSTTMNEHRAKDPIDLYKTASNSAQTGLNNLFHQYAGTEVHTQLSHMLNVLQTLLPDVRVDLTKGEITLERGITKNPMTITVYGSSAAGIANKIADALTSKFYERLSDMAQVRHDNPNVTPHEAMFGGDANSKENYDKLSSSLNALLTHIADSYEGHLSVGQSEAEAIKKWDPENFVFKDEQIGAIQQNLLHLFVNPMREAITKTMGKTVMDNARLVASATQAQSIVLEHTIKQKVKELQDAKDRDPSYKGSDLPSENELQAIRREALKTFPLIDTGSQMFWPVKNDASDLSKTAGRGLFGEYDTAASIYVPSDAGVKGLPMLNIGMGDGMTMQGMLNKGAHGLAVFDGFNMPIDRIAEDGVRANQAVFGAWQGNSMGAVHESFSVFMDHLSPEMLNNNPAMKKALIAAIFGKNLRYQPSMGSIITKLMGMKTKLAEGAASVDARHAAISAHQAHVDQLAGAERPFMNKGRVLTGSNGDVAQALNDHMRGYTSYKEVFVPAGLIENKRSSDLVPVSAKKAFETVAFSPEQRAILDHITKAGSLDNYQVISGSHEQILDYRAKNNLPIPDGFNKSTGGFIDPTNKLIHVMNGSPETVLHEAIHAATFASILAHYEGRDLGKNSAVIKDAIKRIESLRDQFLKLDPTGQSDAFYDASQAIREGRGTPLGEARSLNEFMAWTLANKDLAGLLKETKAHPLAQLAKDVWEQIKRIVFGKSAPQIGDDMLSNLQFNTAIIAQEQPSVADVNRDVMLFHNPSYGTDKRMSDLNETFDKLFSHHLGVQDPLMKADRARNVKDAVLASADLARIAVNQGFNLTPQAHDVFTRTVQALSLEMKFDPSSLIQVDKLYRHIIKGLMPEQLIDPNDPDAQRAGNIAQNKYDMLLGNAGTKDDRFGRSSLLPVFLGLSLVDDGLRSALRKIDLPKAELNKEGTLDARLENIANRGMEALADRLSRQGSSRNSQEAIDALTKHIADSALEQTSRMEAIAEAPNRSVNAANDAFTSWIGQAADTIKSKAADVQAKSTNKFVRAGAGLAEFASNMATEKNGSLVAEGLLAGLNRLKGFHWLREMGADIIGRTNTTAPIFDMIKVIRDSVDKVRQQFREILPTTIASKFTRLLEQHEWNNLHMGLARTDLAKLADHFSHKDTLAMVADASKRAPEIEKLENALKLADPAHFDLVQRKAQQLAEHMTTGKAGVNLLRNAEAISQLLAEKTNPNRKATTKDFVQAIDQLTTLYALDRLDPKVQANLASLVKEQGEAMHFTLSYLVGQRRDEVAKSVGMAKYNAYKGYVPSEPEKGRNLVVANDKDAAALLAKSFVRVQDYKGSRFDPNKESRGYYFAPVEGKAAFNQGLVQNVRRTAGGVDANTGLTVGKTAGAILSRPLVDQIAKYHQRDAASSENLMPVFNEKGKVVAFERAMDPTQLASLNPDTHLAKMIGVWRGRQAEEAMAHQFNMQFVDALHETMTRDLQSSTASKAAYVDLFDPNSYGKDPVIADALSLMPDEVRDYISQKFGGKFLVRRDMINDAIGYRGASIGDAWTGTTRWTPQVQNTIQKLALSVWGNDAYRILVNAEAINRELVGIAKDIIVVKSVIVPMTNFASNMYQLLTRGVGLIDVAKGVPRYMNEANAYTKSQLRKIDAEAELRAAQGAKDVRTQRKLEAEIQALSDSQKRLSIWPLIQAGEFGRISDEGISRDDIILTEGKLHAFIQKQVEKLPEAVQKAGRYVLITKDTALYQGLEKSVQLGDFLGKAIYYEHLTQKRGLSSEAALAKVTEEFVHLDRLPGRSRSYMETQGLQWFYNYKLRSAKIALSMIRDNPLQALIGSMMPINDISPISVESPLHDNIFSKAFHGSLGYSIGPKMLFQVPSELPIMHLLY